MRLKILRALTVFAAVGIGAYTLSYLDFNVKGLLASKGELLETSWYLSIFYTHVITGSVALIIGSFQFFPKLRKGGAKWHRKLGIVYVVTAIFSSSTGLIISIFANGGWIAISGFFTFSAVWLIATIYGFLLIKSGKVLLHKNWMYRSYAACFAAVTLRIWLLIFPFFELDFITAYQIASWMSWVVNLSVAELIIKYGTPNKL